MKYRSSFALMMLLMTSSMHLFASEFHWSYVSPAKPSESFTIRLNPPGFQIDDVIRDAKVCQGDDGYYCLVTDGFSFFIPKRLGENDATWKHGKEVYESKFLENFYLLGHEIDVFIIDSKREKNTIRLLFSKRRGLIGMGGYTKTSSNMFLLNSYCGYGASIECKEY